MINKKMMGCALALGFLALAACSPSNPGESSSAEPAVSDNTNVSASEVVSEIVSENVSVAPIAGDYTFNVSSAYGSAYVFGEGERDKALYEFVVCLHCDFFCNFVQS